MKKAYSYYKSEDLALLGLSVIGGYLFGPIVPQKPSQWLLDTFALNREIPMNSEKAKSELLITPVLVELRKQNPQRFTFFSGYQFDVDSRRGLKGFCDYLISTRYNAAFLVSPIVVVVEAKQNQDLFDASPQCTAEMYAAKLFNEQAGDLQPYIYGAVTNGYEWLFLKLENDTVVIDRERYGLKNLPELLGVWQLIIDSFSDLVVQNQT
jgi:hypothetical protein